MLVFVYFDYFLHLIMFYLVWLSCFLSYLSHLQVWSPIEMTTHAHAHPDLTILNCLFSVFYAAFRKSFALLILDNVRLKCWHHRFIQNTNKCNLQFYVRIHLIYREAKKTTTKGLQTRQRRKYLQISKERPHRRKWFCLLHGVCMPQKIVGYLLKKCARICGPSF